MHREVFGAQGFGAHDSDHGGSSAAMKGVKDNKDPYAQALRYGQKAVRDVNNAVENSNTLLSSARNMISKMMSLKPWAEITKMGKDAEDAGKKTQELAKLARPFIYAQVNTTA